MTLDKELPTQPASKLPVSIKTEILAPKEIPKKTPKKVLQFTIPLWNFMLAHKTTKEKTVHYSLTWEQFFRSVIEDSKLYMETQAQKTKEQQLADARAILSSQIKH